MRSARMAWSFVFTISMIMAWVLRDFAKPLLMKIPCTWRRSGWGLIVWGNSRDLGSECAFRPRC